MPISLHSDIHCLDAFDTSYSVPFRIILVCCPPDPSTYEDDARINSLLELCLSDNHLIVSGDFNLDIGWVQGTRPKRQNLAKFAELLECCSLIQQDGYSR